MVQAKDSVKVGTNLKWMLGLCLVSMMLMLGYIATNLDNVPEDYMSTADVNAKVDAAVLEKETILNEKLSEVQAALDKEIADKAKVIVEEVKASLSYLIDEVYFSVAVNEELSDREVKKLQDTKVDFDSDDYDLEEVITLDGLEVLSNEKDFNGVAYLTIPKDSIEYNVVFDSDLDTSLIDEDETLVFNFLGKEVEISSWDVDKVTMFEGEEYFLAEGESITVNDKIVTLVSVAENDKVYVTVDDEGEVISEDDTERFNGLQIKVSVVFYGVSNSKAGLIIGEDVEKEIVSEDEYAEDSIWEYKISANSIGIVLKEEFMELDDEFKVLAKDESLCLPNDYICVKFDGTLDENFEDISFNIDTKDGNEYVEVDGNFESGLKDYDKLYINSTGIYDEDLTLIGTEVEISNSDSILDMSSGDIVIEDFSVNLDLDVSVSSDEEDFRTDFGILVSNPEDSIDELEWDISVPKEQLENTISVM